MRGALQRFVLHKSEQTPLPAGWHWKRLEDVSILLKPGRFYDETSVSDIGDVPVINQSADQFHGFHDGDPDVMASPEAPVCTFANHTCAMRLMKRPYSSIQNIFSRIGKPGVTDTTFLYYSSLRRLTLSGYKGHHPIYRKQWIPVPPLPIQIEVASILSTYDNLIENNRRRIQLLEQAAQLFYKEWFVHLRFPGHERAAITDGVPEGWERKTIGESFRTTLGGTPSRKKPEYWNGDVPWINSSEVNKTRILSATEFITEEGLSKSAAKLMPAGTTVLAITGATLGQVSRLEIECSANQSVIGIYDEDNCWNEWLYLFFVHEIKKIISHATGGAQQHINKEIVNAVEYLEPPSRLLDAFREEVNPIFSQMKNLGLQGVSLSRAHNLLLPKLMTGELLV